MCIPFYKELAFGLAQLWNRPQVLNGITSDGSTSVPFSFINQGQEGDIIL